MAKRFCFIKHGGLNSPGNKTFVFHRLSDKLTEPCWLKMPVYGVIMILPCYICSRPCGHKHTILFLNLSI